MHQGVFCHLPHCRCNDPTLVLGKILFFPPSRSKKMLSDVQSHQMLWAWQKSLFFFSATSSFSNDGREGKDVFDFFISPYISSSGFTVVQVAGTLWKSIPASHQGPSGVLLKQWRPLTYQSRVLQVSCLTEGMSSPKAEQTGGKKNH